MRLTCEPQDLGGSGKLPKDDPVDRRVGLACAFAQKEAPADWTLMLCQRLRARAHDRRSLPVRTSTSTDAALLLPGEAGGPPTSSRVAGVSSEWPIHLPQVLQPVMPGRLRCPPRRLALGPVWPMRGPLRPAPTLGEWVPTTPQHRRRPGADDPSPESNG